MTQIKTKVTATTAKAETAKEKTSKVNKPEEVKVEATKKNKSSLLHLQVETNLFLQKQKGAHAGDQLFREGILPEGNKNGARKKLRKNLDRFAEGFAFYSENKDTNALKQLKADFAKYYAKIYRTNDYTLASILGGNTRDDRKGTIENMLKVIATIK